MLPAKNRLKNRTDFARVYSRGKLFQGECLALKTTANGLENSRIGFSVGTSYSKKATERNRLKRLLRESFHKILPRIETGKDIVVFAKKSGLRCPFPADKISAEVEALCQKSNLLKNT